MFCKKCGAELPDGTRFCSKCGANLSGGTVQKPEREVSVNAKGMLAGTKKKYAIAISAILGVLVVAVLLFVILVLPNMAVNDFKSQIKDCEYRDAYLTYEEFSSEDRTKANKWMREYIDTVEEDYYAGKLDYSTAIGILEELMQFDAAYNEASKADENVYLDNQSAIVFDRAKEYAAEGKWQEAYEELEDVHIKYRLYDEVSALRNECVTNIRAEALEQIDAFAASGEIDKLIEARDLALTFLPDDKEIIQAAQTHLDAFVTQTLADAETLADSNDFAGAMELLQYAVSMYEHQDFWSALEGYGYDSAEAHCEALVAQNDLLGAVAYANGLAEKDNKYRSLLEKYAPTLVTETLNSAKTLADNRQFAEAVSLINEALAVYSDADLREAVEYYSAYLPRTLAECNVIDKQNANVGKTEQDCFGTTYENTITFSGSDFERDGFAIFNLDGKFINLKGIVVGATGLATDNTVSCIIYADGNVIFESDNLERTTEARSLNIDITGVRQLRIEFSQSVWSRYKPLCIVDLTVS